MLPLVSSDELTRALRRAGFVLNRSTGGSHAVYKKQRDGGGWYVVTVTLGKKEIPRGTLRSILSLAGLSEEQFLDYLS